MDTLEYWWIQPEKLQSFRDIWNDLRYAKMKKKESYSLLSSTKSFKKIVIGYTFGKTWNSPKIHENLVSFFSPKFVFTYVFVF